MVALEFAFPAGRYHATPWGHHVNEGAVEWPPSPWRVLRALLACYHLKSGDVSAEALRDLLEQLAAQTPVFHVPRGAVAHSRHYMPVVDSNPTKVFDTFVQLSSDARLEVQWPDVALERPLFEVLARLAERLGYLGRAESWVEGRALAEPNRAPNVLAASSPSSNDEGATGAQGQDLWAVGPVDRLRLLAPIAPPDIASWRAAAFDERLTRAIEVKRARAIAAGKTSASAKLSKKEQARLADQLPKDIGGLLSLDTTTLHEGGWNRPPGSRWVEYVRPRELLEPMRERRSSSVHERTRLTVARFALASNVLPRWRDALQFGERVRRAVMALSRGDDAFAAPVFSGKDSRQKPLEGHQHAFFLPEAMDGAGRIAQFVVYAPMGFDRRARRVLETLTRVRGGKREGGHVTQVVLLDLGPAEDFEGTLFGPSRVWRSATPFVATRHPKRSGAGYRRDELGLVVGSPEHDVRRLLSVEGFPMPRSVSPVAEVTLGGRGIGWRGFRTRRERGGGRRAQAAPSGFRIEFDEPVFGPVALGYGAHFGLGMFFVG